MPKRCVAAHCSKINEDGVRLHFFPKIHHYRRLWTNFVKTKRPDFTLPDEDSTAVLCSDHFKPDCYEHYTIRFEVAFAVRQRLKSDALPTIQTILPDPSQTTKRAATDSDDCSGPSTKRSLMHKKELAEVCLLLNLYIIHK